MEDEKLGDEKLRMNNQVGQSANRLANRDCQFEPMANCSLTLDKNIVFHNFPVKPVKQTQNKALEGSLDSKSPKNLKWVKANKLILLLSIYYVAYKVQIHLPKNPIYAKTIISQ